jgi:methylated-DNA-[protein]-cysteine S-methyltransferase
MTTTTRTRVQTTTWKSPLGTLLLLSRDGERLCGLFFTDGRHAPQSAPDWVEDPAPFGAAIDQLERYFAAELTAFDLELDPRGTPFQLEVWEALRAIPHGSTANYAELAQTIQRPTAVRAVAAANARNPLSIVVPCHRVIGSDGSLTGYAGGLERKRALLELEAGRAG